jgi:transcriptional regulator with XRE-family HTH domain
MTHAKSARTQAENDVDLHVGQRVKMRRTMLGVSQDKLAEACGITFQQIQKYESASNRISVSRLMQIAAVLEVRVGFFFEGLPDQAEGGADDPMKSNVALDVVRMFGKLDPGAQKNVTDLLRTMAGERPPAQQIAA